jgi:hypothetical protein
MPKPRERPLDVVQHLLDSPLEILLPPARTPNVDGFDRLVAHGLPSQSPDLIA